MPNLKYFNIGVLNVQRCNIIFFFLCFSLFFLVVYIFFRIRVSNHTTLITIRRTSHRFHRRSRTRYSYHSLHKRTSCSVVKSKRKNGMDGDTKYLHSLRLSAVPVLHRAGGDTTSLISEALQA